MKEYTKTITVVEDDLDDLDHVNNVRYVQWVQDIAKEHWQAEATPDMLENYIWMVLTNFIEYKGQAFLGDTLLLKTYIHHAKGAISTRMVEIYHQRTEKLLLRSKAEWCLVNNKTKRPMRLTDDLKNLFT